MRDCIYTTKTFTLLTMCLVTLILTYSSGFVIIITDKTSISVVSWHQMDTQRTRFVLDTRLVFETRLIFETRLLLEQSPIPQYVMGTRLLLETRLVLEVLR